MVRRWAWTSFWAAGWACWWLPAAPRGLPCGPLALPMPLRARNFWPHSSIKSLVVPQRAHNFGHHSSSSFAVPCRVSHRPAASPVAGAGDSGRVRPLGWQEPRLNPLPSTTPKTAQKHSSCLSETPLYERMRFGLHFGTCTHIGRSASDCLVPARLPLAASAASATKSRPTCSFCTLPTLGAAVCRRFDAP